MDVFTILSIVVAVVTVISGYVLFNPVPTLGSGTDTGRQTRRP